VSAAGKDDDDIPAAASALPSHAAEARDALGNVCFYLHFAVMIYIVLGWAVPLRGALLFYEFFLPAVAIQWQFNKNSCVLNNVEEGAWLLTLATNVLGYPFKAWHIDVFTYFVLVVLWCAGLSHLLWW